MDQPGMLVTAPEDPDPQWPDGFVEVLRGAGAKEKNIPYCLGWVRRFFARFPGRLRWELGRAEIETFLSEAATHPGVSNWQVQQARDALELYYERFLGVPLMPREALGMPNDTTHDPIPSSQAATRSSRPSRPERPSPATRAEYARPAGLVNSEDGIPEASASAGAAPLGRCNWEALETRLRDILRIEHYSYSTEQTLRRMGT